MVYIELPEAMTCAASILQRSCSTTSWPAETKPVGHGDHDKNVIPDLMCKFRRSAVEAILSSGKRVIVTVTGMVGTMAFEGVDIIRVINP